MCMYVCVYVHSLCVGPCFTLCFFMFSTVWCLCVGLGPSEPTHSSAVSADWLPSCEAELALPCRMVEFTVGHQDSRSSQLSV